MSSPDSRRRRQGSDDEELGSGGSSQQATSKVPTLMMRKRDTQSPATRTVTARPDTSQQLPRPAKPEMKAAAPQQARSVKLIDSRWFWLDEVEKYLGEEANFHVVSVVGRQGVGKSLLCDLLASSHIATGQTPRRAFTTASLNRQLHNGAETIGCDIFVTWHRVIIIDTQALWGPGVVEEMMRYDKKSEQSVDTSSLLQTLQMLAFVMSISHTVLVQSDNAAELSDLSQLLRTADLLRPTPNNISGSGATDTRQKDLQPRVVFVVNEQTPRSLHLPDLQRHISSSLTSSQLQYADGLTNCLRDTRAVNVWLLLFNLHSDGPDLELRRSVEDLYFTLVRAQRGPLGALRSFSDAPLTELQWLSQVTKTWEVVKKSTTFLDFSRLLVQ